MQNGKFKFIAGLGNRDFDDVFKSVSLYIEAGADIIDISPFLLDAIRQKLAAKKDINLKNVKFCISVAIKGDVHGKKALINKEKCKKCNLCKKVCMQNAMLPPVINEDKCIGCAACLSACPNRAIELYDACDCGLDYALNCGTAFDIIEIHISTRNKSLIISEFKKIINKIKNINCTVCAALSRKYFSNTDTLILLEKLKKLAGNKEFCVQTDGYSMNSGKSGLKSTIEAAAFGIFVKNAGYDVILSGGTNDCTAKLVNLSGLECSAGYGSYARKIVSGLEYGDALKIAKKFVSETKELINVKKR